MFNRVPLLTRPRRAHRRARALQGVFLACFAPMGWIAIQTILGVSPWEVVLGNPGLMAYMLAGTMGAFGCFGWLLGREEERLSRLAMLDELTGLANNRLFGSRLDECLAASRRKNMPMSLLLMDMDRFKDINDTHGHQAGDQALKTAAAVIRSCVRTSDIAARIGGEEFAVILPETSTREAEAVAGRVLNGLRKATVRLGGGASVSLSASIGLSGGIAAKEESAFALFAEADKALYKAKTTGRDRLVSA